MALMSQVSAGYPRVPRDCFCPDTGIFITLSGYGRKALGTEFLAFLLSLMASYKFSEIIS